MSDQVRRPPFEEQAALQELEDLRRAIDETRARRTRANEAFDQFLKSFSAGERDKAAAVADAAPVELAPDLRRADAALRSSPPPPQAAPVPRSDASPGTPGVAAAQPAASTPPPASVTAQPVAPAVQPIAAALQVPPLDVTAPIAVLSEPSDPSAMPPAPSMLPSSGPLPGPPVERPAPDVFDERGLDAFAPDAPDWAQAYPAPASAPHEPFPSALAPPPRRPPLRRPAVAGAAVAVLAAVAVVFFGRSGKDDVAPGATPQSSTAPAAANGVPAASAVPAAEPAPAPAPPAPGAELVTARRVWLRVTVDGARTVEREVPADTRLTFAPTKEMVVRAGDAGAVRMRMAGKDMGPIGPDGQVATRTFAVTADR